MIASVPSSGAPATIADSVDVLLLDLDGVVYRGHAAVPHAVETLAWLQRDGAVRLAYVTNNASRPPAEVAAQLRGLGLDAARDDVVTSAQAGARLLADQLPTGSPVLAVGGPGLVEALEGVGLRAVTSADHAPLGVLQGFGPDVGWAQLAEASYAVAAGLPWVATNTDLTVPTDRGTAPGNGALVQTVVQATGRHPVVAGKPKPPLLQESLRRTGARRALFVGDRLDTDIGGAVAVGLPSLLVLTGVSDLADVLAAPAGQRPTHLAADLRALLVAPRHPTPDGSAWRCGRWRAQMEHGRLGLTSVFSDVEGGSMPPTDGLDALRAAAKAAWNWSDQGKPFDLGAAIASVTAGVDADADAAEPD